MVYIAVFEQLM